MNANIHLKYHTDPDECWQFVVTQNGKNLWDDWFCPVSDHEFLDREPFYAKCRDKALEMGISLEEVEELFEDFRSH